jgi:hypothetical protein
LFYEEISPYQRVTPLPPRPGPRHLPRVRFIKKSSPQNPSYTKESDLSKQFKDKTISAVCCLLSTVCYLLSVICFLVVANDSVLRDLASHPFSYFIESSPPPSLFIVCCLMSFVIGVCLTLNVGTRALELGPRSIMFRFWNKNLPLQPPQFLVSYVNLSVINVSPFCRLTYMYARAELKLLSCMTVEHECRFWIKLGLSWSAGAVSIPQSNLLLSPPSLTVHLDGRAKC